MLKILFDRYKYVALAVLFVIYSVGVWNVSSRLTDNGYLRTALNRTEEIITLKQANDELIHTISKNYQDSLTKLEKDHLEYKTLRDKELASAPQYTDCAVTPGMRDLYRKRLGKSK